MSMRLNLFLIFLNGLCLVDAAVSASTTPFTASHDINKPVDHRAVSTFVAEPRQLAKSDSVSAFLIDNKINSIRGGAVRASSIVKRNKQKTTTSAPLADSQKFLIASTIIVLGGGISILVAPWEIVQEYVAPMLQGVDEPTSKLIKTIWGAAQIGWAVGKIVAIKSGPDAVRKFCQLNIIPFSIVYRMVLQTNSIFDIIVFTLLGGGYLYFGYLQTK